MILLSDGLIWVWSSHKNWEANRRLGIKMHEFAFVCPYSEFWMKARAIYTAEHLQSVTQMCVWHAHIRCFHYPVLSLIVPNSFQLIDSFQLLKKKEPKSFHSVSDHFKLFRKSSTFFNHMAFAHMKLCELRVPSDWTGAIGIWAHYLTLPMSIKFYAKIHIQNQTNLNQRTYHKTNTHRHRPIRLYSIQKARLQMAMRAECCIIIGCVCMRWNGIQHIHLDKCDTNILF